MAAVTAITGSTFEDSTFFLLARIHGLDNTAIIQADVSAIVYQIFDLQTDPSTPIATGVLTISVVVFDTLQTDARWDVDTTGYNFRWQLLSNVLTEAKHTYRIEVKFTAGTNEDFSAVWEVTTATLYSS